MNVEFWNRWLSWATIILPLLAVAASAGVLYTRSILNARTATEISALKPWALSPDQAEKLTQELGAFTGKISFIHRLMDGEGRDFAGQLASTFKASGWTVGTIAGNSLNDLPGKVTVAISNPDLRGAADRLCDTLNRAGIPCGGDLRPNSLGGPLDLDVIYIIVGRKQRGDSAGRS